MNELQHKVSAAILAGGKSSRMNSPKGLIEVDGKSLIDGIAETLKKVSDEVFVIANDERYFNCNLPVYKDLILDSGPAAGIYTALQYASHEHVVVVSCDSPFVSAEFLKYLLSQNKGEGITVPIHEGKIEPLIAVYKKSTQGDLLNHIHKGQIKMHDILHSMNANFVEVPNNLFSENIFFNINTPEELATAFPQSKIS